MSAAFPLPPRPKLEEYRKLAKGLLQAGKSIDKGAVRDWAVRWAERLARLRGLKLTLHLRRRIASEVEWLERHWRKFMESPERAGEPVFADAQYFVARGHGFSNWAEFTGHVRELSQPHSLISRFELAVNAIINGKTSTLKKLLRENPELVHARSTRDRRSTLLHYVSANGVEDFRQKTPKNIVSIAKLLLVAGADVNAESNAYGGRSTTLGLTATSCHPEDAGVQMPLLELMLEYGAVIDGPDPGSGVCGCLHNGRGEAAEFLASRGARLDLEGAAGVGQLGVVKSFLSADGRLKPPATEQQLRDGFAWACQFGRTSVVDFLLQRGLAVDTRLRHDGQTGLHWAAYGGHADTVKLLLRRSASISARDDSYDGTPLDWAVYAWGTRTMKGPQSRSYYKVVKLLAQAGAKLRKEWYLADLDRRRALKRLRSEPGMLAVLRGKITN